MASHDERVGADTNVSSNTGNMISCRDFNEAVPATPSWTIVCLVLGGSELISIEAQPYETVHKLKKTIKSEEQHRFKGFDANQLTLHKVNISALGNFEEEIKALNLPRKGMNGGLRLRHYYQTPPEEELIHILIQPPPNSPIVAGDQEDITDQLVAKWSRSISGLSIMDLRAYLQRPLAEEEKIPIPQRQFDRLSKHPFLAGSSELALSCEQVATLFRVSTDEWAEDAETVFACAIASVPPASGTKNLFHATWDNNISSILGFILSNGKPIRNSNDDTGTALKWPDYGFLIKNHCVLRGEEQGSDGAGDPERDLVDKRIWSYDPLPYIIGYHARTTDVQFVAITQSGVTTIPLFDHDLRFKKERIANLVHLIRLSGVVAGLGKQLHLRHRPEFVEFDREGGLVKISIGAVVRKEFRHPDAVAHVSKLIKIYGLLKSKQVPNVDSLDRAETHGDYPHVQLSPVGYETLPKSGSEALNAVVCVLEALKAMHSSPNPVYHRDIRDPNIIKRLDGKGWFLIDWSDASTAPTRAATHLKESEHSPRVRQDGHGQEVDIWGVGRYLEDLASRVSCQIAKPEAVKRMARRWMIDLTTSAAAALDEINANQGLFTAPEAQIG